MARAWDWPAPQREVGGRCLRWDGWLDHRDDVIVAHAIVEGAVIARVAHKASK